MCSKASTANLLPVSLTRLVKGSTFVEEGFSNWKNAREKFKLHESSGLHSESLRVLSTEQTQPINAVLSDVASKQQNLARTVLELLFRSIKFWGRQGIALRGHENRDGTLWQLMLERTHSLPEARQWLLRRDNWMSNVVQNEILRMFGHAIQQQIVSEAKNCHFFGLTADGTTDISGKEQFSCSLQFVDSTLVVRNTFLGFYNAPDVSANTLFLSIKDIFIRLDLPIERLQGYCFDGAANMSGQFNGVRAKLKDLCADSLYIHCSNHALDLILQEAAKEVRFIADTLNFVQGVSVVFTQSAKRKSLFRSLFGREDAVCNLLSVCPTRWCVRASAISRVLSCYSELLACLNSLVHDNSVKGDTRAKIHGLLKQAKTPRIVFGLLCSKAIFGPAEIVARGLQDKNASARSTLESIAFLKAKFLKLREDRSFAEQIEKVDTYASANHLSYCVSRRHPSNLEETNKLSDSKRLLWRQQYFEVLDLILSAIDSRFQQTDLLTAAARETYLVNSIGLGATTTNSMDVPDLDSLPLPNTMDKARLKMELALIRDYTADLNMTSVQQLATFLISLNAQTRNLFKEVTKYAEQCLCLPILAASSERSFSALRRLKTWLRSSMTQERLTHVSLMHVHQNELQLDKINIKNLMKSFINNTSERKGVFGVL